MLDIGYAPSDPQKLVADVKAAGARAVGLYAINLSAPGTVVSPAYAQEVHAAGLEVLPIITPGQSPPPMQGVPAELSAWGHVNQQNRVGLDIEQPGVDTPSEAWVGALTTTLTMAGYLVDEYTNLRAEYPNGHYWAVDWNHDPPQLPAGADMVQGGVPFTGPTSGAQYDQDYLAPGVLDPAPGPVGAPEDAEVQFFHFAGDGFDHLVWVNGDRIQHRYQQPGGNPAPQSDWGSEYFGVLSGVTYTGAVVVWAEGASQLHIAAAVSDGSARHFWQAPGKPWNPESL